MTDAEIAGIMGWRGPGAYTAATLRKIRSIIDQVQAAEREACALACEAWGQSKVDNWRDDPEMLEDAKARAWDATMCATAVRARSTNRAPAQAADRALASPAKDGGEHG